MSELPKAWKRVPIGAVCRLINGRAFKPIDWTADGLPIIRIQNLNNPSAPFNRFDREVEPKFYVQPGELLFAWSGTPGTSFGAHIWNGPRAILNQHIFRVLFDDALFEKRFLRWAINERLNELISVAHGGAGLAHVTKPVFEAAEIILAPRAEQNRIVARLDALQSRSRRAKEALDAIPSLLERFRQSVLAAAFRGDLTAEWRAKNPDVEPASELLKRIRTERRRRWEEAELAKLKAKGKTPGDDRWKAKYQQPAPVDPGQLVDVPEGWAWASLDEVVREEIAYGVVQPGPPVEAGVSFVRAMDLEDGVILEEQLGTISANIANEYLRTRLVPGDVLLGIVRAAKVAVVPQSLAGGNIVRGIARIPPTSGIRSDFLAGWLRGPIAQELFLAKTRGIDMPVINLSDVRRLPVPIAPMAEQVAMRGTSILAFLRIRALVPRGICPPRSNAAQACNSTSSQISYLC